jgi:GDPmannose 4,6-dehydratase
VSPRALITGISGQDGFYLTELLLGEGYEVAGLVRPRSGAGPHLEAHLARLTLLPGDLLEPGSLVEAVRQVSPDELYHLAAPTYVPASWDAPAETIAAIAGATATLLAGVARLATPPRVYVATSSEIFGAVAESPQSELTPLAPTTPYGVAKAAAHRLVAIARERQGLHACAGITYNHESPRRAERFVTRKVTRAAAAIKLGLARELVLGDLDAVRDWSYAGDTMRGAQLALRHEEPADYVLASGVGRTVRELAQVAFSVVGLDFAEYLRVDPALVRPADPVPRVGDPTKARRVLGWEPRVGFDELIAAMVQADLDELGG